jgi:sodium-dependent dicarboxylate transporter 2/3/5
MLVAGGLGLGIAIVDVGLSDIIMQKVNTLPLPTVGIVLIFGIVAVLMSNVMSNTAAASILVPLGMALPYPFGIAAPLVVAISCAAALFLPVSTPPNAIAYATEMLEQKDFRPGGVFFALTGPAVAFIAVLTWVWLVF